MTYRQRKKQEPVIDSMVHIIFKQQKKNNASNQIRSILKIHCSSIHIDRLQQNVRLEY